MSAAVQSIAPHVSMSLQTIELFTSTGDVIEIRALGVGRTASSPGCIYSGYFERSNHKALIGVLRQLDGKCDGIYTTINQVNPALLARSSNRLQARPKHTTTDADIIARLHLYVDIDSVRPAGISATDDEHQAAIGCAKQIASDLTEMGFPEAFIGDSGNGGHLHYRLPADLDLAAGDDLVKRVLLALDSKYSNHQVKIDTATGNRSRICRLYGTMARKGDSTPDRPHRRSIGLSGPERFEAVPLELLERLAADAPAAILPSRSPQSAGIASEFDFDGWISRVNLDVVKGPDAYQGGRRWILKACPFNPDHTERPAIIQFASGALVFKCQHNSCRENGWKAFRDFYEPYRQQKASALQSPPRHAEAAPAAATNELIIYDVAELLALDVPAPEFLIDGLIPRRGAVLVNGKAKSGKTLLAVQLALSVASGRPFLDTYKVLAPGPVLLLEQDDPSGAASVKDILRRSVSSVAGLPFYLAPQVPFTFGMEFLDWLGAEIERRGLRLVVLDSYTALRGSRKAGGDIVKQEQTDMRMLDEVAKRLDCTIVLLHHTSKGSVSLDWTEQGAGSFAMGMAVEALLHVSRYAELGIAAPERLVRVQGRHLTGTEFALRFRKESLDYDHVIEGGAASMYPVLVSLKSVFGTKPFSPKDLTHNTGVSAATAHRQIERLRQAGVLSRRGFGEYALEPRILGDIQ